MQSTKLRFAESKAWYYECIFLLKAVNFCSIRNLSSFVINFYAFIFNAFFENTPKAKQNKTTETFLPTDARLGGGTAPPVSHFRVISVPGRDRCLHVMLISNDKHM